MREITCARCGKKIGVAGGASHCAECMTAGKGGADGVPRYQTLERGVVRFEDHGRSNDSVGGFGGVYIDINMPEITEEEYGKMWAAVYAEIGASNNDCPIDSAFKWLKNNGFKIVRMKPVATIDTSPEHVEKTL